MTTLPRRRGRQVVRQRSAKPLMAVRFRLAPPTLSTSLFILSVALMEHSAPVSPPTASLNRSKMGRAQRTAPLLSLCALGSKRNASERSKGSNPMKKLIFMFLALSAFAIPSRAQSVDVSAGYSYFRLGGSGGVNQNGVSGSVAYNFKSFDWLGIVGDFGVYHPLPFGAFLNAHTCSFGPPLPL